MLACARVGEQVAALHWPNRVTDDASSNYSASYTRSFPGVQPSTMTRTDRSRAFFPTVNAEPRSLYMTSSQPVTILMRHDWFSQEGIIPRLASDRVLERLPRTLDELATSAESL